MKVSISQTIETKNFDPAEFIGKGWKFGSASGQPAVSSSEEINLASIGTVSMLRKGEPYASGEATRARLVEKGAICLPPAVGWLFFKNQRLIPQEWKQFDRVYFDGGPELLDPDGDRYAFYLYRHGGKWYWFYSHLDDSRDSSHPSAVLA